jgi:hypothetical protein
VSATPSNNARYEKLIKFGRELMKSASYRNIIEAFLWRIGYAVRVYIQEHALADLHTLSGREHSRRGGGDKPFTSCLTLIRQSVDIFSLLVLIFDDK